MSFPSKSYIFPYIGRKQVANDTWSFFFDTRQSSYKFLPGQYNNVTLNTPYGSGKVSNSFTIASSPLTTRKIALTTKEGKSEFKRVLFALTPGSPVSFFGPLGGFILRDTKKSQVVFLSGGLGITPFYAMTSYAHTKRLPISMTILAAFSKKTDILYQKEFERFARESKMIRVVYTITSERKIPFWEGEKGRISPEMIRKHVPDVENVVYYLAGPVKMVSQTEEILLGLGISPEQIYLEQFIGYSQ